MQLFSIQISAVIVAVLSLIILQIFKIRYTFIKDNVFYRRLIVIISVVIYSTCVYWTHGRERDTLFAIAWRGVVYEVFLYHWIYEPLRHVVCHYIRKG